jgi:hypothetical protein
MLMGMGRAYKHNKKADDLFFSVILFPFKIPFIILGAIFGGGKKRKRRR